MKDRKPVQTELNLQNVTGPVLYSHPIPERIGSLYTNEVIRFFIPIDFFKSSSDLHPNNLFGTNVYPITSPLPAVCVHQGIISKISSRPEETFAGARVLNIYEDEDNYALDRVERFELKNVTEKVIGVDLIIRITGIRSYFEGSKQFDVKTKGSMTITAHGFAVIFGQTIYSQVEAFDMELLSLLKQLPDDSFYDERNWLRFGLTGEPIDCYDVRDFCDDGIPFSKWLSQKLRASSLYFDTMTDRYEMAMMLNGDKIILKLAKLHQPLQSIAQIRSDGTPIKQTSKTYMMDQIEWENVEWSEEGVTINGEFFGPIVSYFWAKRKRPLQ
ncbi:hypothetical protein TRFO_42483 [Tritrichomonas foetus]|uniref:Uncharacterized protein n=1 Tax=Tritrichomonas foetus TaxID=1144522 RepID=A0A1J4KW21_9EUKA|nr:hypothetical protein TRFO_42483 [Tritrichomonas foetus]|eukprot:OHT15431.1 hypothetical protein TRFO_42483 [Tritrichomonas foetus]